MRLSVNVEKSVNKKFDKKSDWKFVSPFPGYSVSFKSVINSLVKNFEDNFCFGLRVNEDDVIF